MRKVALLGAGVALFDVVFSPFSLVAANNERDPNSPIAPG